MESLAVVFPEDASMPEIVELMEKDRLGKYDLVK